jgi:hypothetical protein
MRTPLDLIELPYSFSQLGLMLANEFCREAHERGVHLSAEELEALHRARLLVPFYRETANARALREARHSRQWAFQLGHWSIPSRANLVKALSEDRLRDPDAEPLRSRRQRLRTVEMRTYETSVYVYCPHQLSALSFLGAPIAHLDRHRPRGEDEPIRLKAPAGRRREWVRQARVFRDVSIVAAALEPVYYPRITGRLRLHGAEDIEDFDRWRERVSASSLLHCLKLDADWLTDSAAMLLNEADRIDPLGGWAEVVARADAERWKLLRGSARRALDLRITAELLLACHDDLAGAVPSPPQSRPRVRGPFALRLKPTRPLDEMLTEFGLSPHPRLVLVVEGATELLLIPRAMAILGISGDEDVISVQNAEGVEKDLNALVGFIAPRVKRDAAGRTLDLIRPPTRLLVVLDPEKRMRTRAGRARQRDIWVDRILRAIPDGPGNATVREQIEPLVELMTWNTRGEAFEFAHFTDRQIAAAILRLPKRSRSQTQQEATSSVAKIRAAAGNLESMFPHSSKGRLASELLPLMERKLERALTSGTAERIPLVKVLDRAVELAYEFPRGSLVIGLTPPGEP